MDIKGGDNHKESLLDKEERKESHDPSFPQNLSEISGSQKNANSNNIEDEPIDTHEESKINKPQDFHKNIAEFPINSGPTSRLTSRKDLKGARRKKAPKRSVWDEILDSLIFCYEFIMIICVIASGTFLPAIPSSIYVFLSLIYLGLQIVIHDPRTSNYTGMVTVGLQLLLVIAFLIFKIIISILIERHAVSYNVNLYKSLGVTIKPGDATLWLITQTFISEVVTLTASILLLID